MSISKPLIPHLDKVGRVSKLSKLRSLPEQIADRIYDAIVSGEFLPGEKIREEALSEEYQVSRGPIREALRLLERDSVVTVQSNRGAHVTPLSPVELNEIFEVRKFLLGAIVRRLRTMPEAFLSEFRDGVVELELLSTDPNASADYSAASVAIGLQLAHASGNKKLIEILSSLARQSWRYTQLALRDQHRRIESASNWRRLYDALLNERYSEAGDAMEKLIDDARLEALRLLGESSANTD
jgi:DNA-binding GntR family transcriptional regulator